jgi:hypothetical protein
MAKATSKSDPFPPYQATTLPDGKLFVRSTGEMRVPAGGAHVRQIEFRFPRLADDAVIMATAVPADSPGLGFVVFSVKVNDIKGGATGTQTQIVVSAQSVDAAPMLRRKLRDLDIKPMPVLCSIMATGTAVHGPARKTRAKRRTKQ